MGEKLEKLYFGDVDGETESQRQDFQDMFYDEEDIYQQVQDEKFVILGRKGTGKTIIGEYLKVCFDKDTDYSYCKICDSGDLNLCKLIEIGEQQINVQEGELVWQYMLYSILAEVLSEDQKGLKKLFFWSSSCKLRKFLKREETRYKENGMKKSNQKNNRFTTQLNKIGTHSERNYSTDITYELRHYYDKIKPLKKNVLQTLGKKNVILIIDDLDNLNLSATMDVYYSQCIANLVRAVSKINREFKEIPDNRSKIIILLRDDIINYINENHSNFNKIVSNKVIRIDWWNPRNKDGRKEAYEHPLMKMILRKIKTSSENLCEKTDKEVYQIIFPEKIGNKDCMQYLLEFSLGRPRDIIQFLNIVKDRHKTEKVFRKKYFKECEGEYSIAFKDELDNELNIHENSAMIKDAMKMISDLKRINFSYELIEKHYMKMRRCYSNIDNLDEALKVLYSLGIIGNTWTYTNRNGEKKYGHSWAYRLDGEREVNLAKNFYVHRALWKVMSLNN